MFHRLAAVLILTGTLGLSACRSPQPPPTPIIEYPALPETTTAPLPIKLTVTVPGIYIITAADLAALGFAAVNPENLQISLAGEPQPIWIQPVDGNPHIYFYGQPTSSRYTAQNTYLLEAVPDSHLRMHETDTAIPAAAAGSQDTVLVHLHLEQNKRYEPLAQQQRPWFWSLLTPNTPENISFDLPTLAPGPAHLRAAFWGRSQSPTVTPDHHLRIQINGTLITDFSWDGENTHEISATIPAGVLQPGENNLTIETPGDTGLPAEVALLDWIAIKYPQQLTPPDVGQLAFTAQGATITLKQFHSPPLLFDITNPSAVTLTKTQVDQPTPVIPEHQYLAVGLESFLHPQAFSLFQAQPDLQDPEIAADYLAIGPEDLLTNLQPLLEWRTNQGLKTLAIPVAAIYDQFNHGQAGPDAIRTFLRFAARNWPSPPRYLLLVGDGSFDTQGYVSKGQANLLPSFFIHANFGGETVSDIEFARLDANATPDLAVGRVPAATPDQVAAFVQKTLAYEQQPVPTDWTSHILAVADNFEPTFAQEAQHFLDQLPAEYTSTLLAPPPNAAGVSSQISQALDEGVLFLSYFGHGSLTQLGKEQLFTVEDAAALTNRSRLPIMINITCLAGLYTHPTTQSLAEVMLWNEDGGAVAALAATSLTLTTDQRPFVDALAREITAAANQPTPALGDILLAAQNQVPLQLPGVREVVDTFLLFGDPALRLPLQISP